MKKFTMAVCLTAVIGAFAQWGGGMGGGFGGPQSGGNKMEYSEKFASENYVGDGKKYHAMDIYLPKEAKDLYPVVIHTYGSAWSKNNYKDSADLNTICAALLKAGYAVVTPNHRSASDAIYPAQLHDLKALVRYLRGSADKYKLDTSFIAMSGFSSGGHLSSLVATTCGLKEGKSGSVTVDLEGDLGEFTSFSSCVDAATLWSPPTDIYSMKPIKKFTGSGTYEGAFIGVERDGNEDKWKVASSPYYASEGDVPTILFHGTSDQVVNPEQSKMLYDSLQKYKVKSELVSVPGGSHGGNGMYSSENLSKMTDFFDEVRKAKAENADTSSKETTRLIANKNGSSFDVKLEGNKLRVNGAEMCSYKIYSVDGAYAFSEMLQKQLDLSVLPPGIYGIVVSVPSGEQKSLKFVRK